MTLVIPDILEPSCTTRQALERLASKWRVLLIYALLDGPQRHADLRRRLPDITQKVLTETLRRMEADGLVERRVVKATAPGHVEYTLTALGKTLQEPLAAICDWVAARIPPTAPDLRKFDVSQAYQSGHVELRIPLTGLQRRLCSDSTTTTPDI